MPYLRKSAVGYNTAYVQMISRESLLSTGFHAAIAVNGVQLLGRIEEL